MGYDAWLPKRGESVSYIDYLENKALVIQQMALYRQDKLTLEEFKRIGEFLRSPDLTNWKLAKAIMDAKEEDDE